MPLSPFFKDLSWRTDAAINACLGVKLLLHNANICIKELRLHIAIAKGSLSLSDMLLMIMMSHRRLHLLPSRCHISSDLDKVRGTDFLHRCAKLEFVNGAKMKAALLGTYLALLLGLSQAALPTLPVFLWGSGDFLNHADRQLGLQALYRVCHSDLSSPRSQASGGLKRVRMR